MKKILEYIKPLYLRMLIGFLIKLAGTVMDLGDSVDFGTHD